MKRSFALGVVMLASLVCAGAAPRAALGLAQAAAQSSAARRIGAIKAIHGTVITLAPDSGAEIAVNVQPSTRLLRIAPGEKDLKNATPIALSDLQVGDRILVGGKLSDDGTALNASTLVAMKAADVSAHQQQVREDWQKRGIGGLVSSVDPSTGTITISVTGFSGKKSIAIHTSKDTIFRRYAPDSVKFEDASPSSLALVHGGDQLRARGSRSADGTEFTAEEVVTGAFRNIAGTVNSVDASSGTLSVQDVLSKKAVQVKISSDSQLHQLPAEMAQRIAIRLKAAIACSMPAGMPGGSTGAPSGEKAHSESAAGAGGMGGGMRAGGAPDFQQMLSRMPAVTLTDLHKGDAVMIVSTEGSGSSASTVITLLSGVDAILRAAPNGSQAMMLTPWSLGGAPGGDAGNQ